MKRYLLLPGVLALAGQIYSVREGYRQAPPWLVRLSGWITLETMIIAGLGCWAIGLAILASVVAAWSARGFGPADSVLPAVLGVLFLTLGAQNILGAFLLAILGGNEAKFLKVPVEPAPSAAQAPVAAIKGR